MGDPDPPSSILSGTDLLPVVKGKGFKKVKREIFEKIGVTGKGTYYKLKASKPS